MTPREQVPHTSPFYFRITDDNKEVLDAWLVKVRKSYPTARKSDLINRAIKEIGHREVAKHAKECA